MPRVYDLIVLDGELDTLRRRIAALEEVPGLVHVICESPVTFRGTPKPLRFWEAREQFAPWRTRWNHVRVEPDEMKARTPEGREAAQREYLLHGFNGEPGDILLYGDVTDIPDADVVTGLACRRTIPPVMLGGTTACCRRNIGSIADLVSMAERKGDT